MTNPRVLLIGSTGRLGSFILKSGLTFSGKLNAQNKNHFLEFVNNSDIILDVSHPNISAHYIRTLTKLKKRIPYVVGCTGWKQSELKVLNGYSKTSPVLLAPNFSLLIQLVANFLTEYSKTIKQFGYSTYISETHHKNKKDKPSGTAKMFDGILQKKGFKTKIVSFRKGSVVGSHEILFSGKKDTLLIKHEALNRELFAEGAEFATRWLFKHSKKCRSGLFSMQNAIQK